VSSELGLRTSPEALPLPPRSIKASQRRDQVFSSLKFEDYKQISVYKVEEQYIGLMIHFLDGTTDMIGNWIPTAQCLSIYSSGDSEIDTIGFEATNGIITNIAVYSHKRCSDLYNITFRIGDVCPTLTKKRNTL